MTTLTPQEALQAIADGESLECRWYTHDEWQLFGRLNNGVTIEAILKGYFVFRPLPKTITIGDVSFPKPVSKALEENQKYFIPDFTVTRLYYTSQWCNTDLDNLRLKRGLIHLSQENAIAHAKALIKLSGGNVDE